MPLFDFGFVSEGGNYQVTAARLSMSLPCADLEPHEEEWVEARDRDNLRGSVASAAAVAAATGRSAVLPAALWPLRSSGSSSVSSISSNAPFGIGQESLLPGSAYVEEITMWWHSTSLLQASSAASSPIHREVLTYVRELQSQTMPEDDMCEDLRFSKSGTVGPAVEAARLFGYKWGQAGLRSVFGAKSGNHLLHCHNIRDGWAGFEELSIFRQARLNIRRKVLRLPSAFFNLFQAAFAIFLVSVDTLIGEVGAFLLILDLERFHPLLLRQKFAWHLLRGRSIVLGHSLVRRRDLQRSMALTGICGLLWAPRCSSTYLRLLAAGRT